MTKLTPAKLAMLRAARYHGNAFHHLRPSQFQSGYKTRDSLMSAGLLQFGDVYVEITDAGRKVLAEREGKR